LHAPYWFADHRNRPFYIASVRSYWIRSMDCRRNQVMWSLMNGQGGVGLDLQPEVLKYHSDEGRSKDPRCRVQIDGSRLGFFEIGWLEQRRVSRHLYTIEWAEAKATGVDTSTASSLKLGVVALDAMHFRLSRPSAPLASGTVALVSARATDPLMVLVTVMVLLQAAAIAAKAPRLLLLTTGDGASSQDAGGRGPTSSATYCLWGLVRSARQEAGEWLMQGLEYSRRLRMRVSTTVLARMVSEPELKQLASPQRGSKWRCSRLSRMAPIQSGPMQLTIPTRGTIRNLQLRQHKANSSSHVFGAWHAKLSVRSVGLNFRDVLNVIGEYPGDPGLPGLDSCGSIIEIQDATHLKMADCAFGFAFGSLVSFVCTDARLLVRKPRAVSTAQATTLPITWSTAHVAFLNAQLRSRKRALVHTAAGGVGLIALEYAWLSASEVIATAGVASKHRVLREQVSPGCHPLISLSSRSGGAFAAGASHHLLSSRLHAVLNGLSGDLSLASFGLLGQDSSFTEIGKRG
jgi:hypothetical protein